MKTIAKIAIPLAILVSLVGCSSSKEELKTEKSNQSIACPFTTEQMAKDKEDFFEIQSYREARRTGKLTEQMEAAGMTLGKVNLMLNIYDEIMKSCK